MAPLGWYGVEGLGQYTRSPKYKALSPKPRTLKCSPGVEFDYSGRFCVNCFMVRDPKTQIQVPCYIHRTRLSGHMILFSRMALCFFSDWVPYC